MAASNLLALIDDIATLLDDVALMSKVAVKKTAGVLGDDLALNAEQVSGITADRELSVVWAVAKGSLINKAILVPAALIISWLIPWAITPLLMLGGLFLCYEGCEKLAHKFFSPPEESEEHHRELINAVANPQIDLVAFEKDKIKGAIRTDFILSAEIVVISLGVMRDSPLSVRIPSLVAIGILMTVGVYGLVAGIVKIDDLGLWLNRSRQTLSRKLGTLLILSAPILMKTLSVAGTAAMFMVGGGIIVHGISPVHHLIEGLTHPLGAFSGLISILSEMLVGLISGALVLAVIELGKRLRKG